MIVAITGVAATGKTKTARALAKRMKWKLIRLDVIAKKKKLYLGYDEKRKSWIVDLKKLKKEIRKSERKNKNIIIESLYAHFLPADIIIVLRTNPKVLQKRLAKKYTWPTKIKENYEAEMLGLITVEALEKSKRVYEIDTTKATPIKTANIIEKLISDKTKNYKVGKIQWLR